MSFSKLKINARLMLAFGIIVAILVALITATKISQGKQVRSQAMNIHTYEVMQQADHILQSLINMETGHDRSRHKPSLFDEASVPHRLERFHAGCP